MKFKIIELKTSGGITVQDLQNKPNIGEMFNIQEKWRNRNQWSRTSSSTRSEDKV